MANKDAEILEYLMGLHGGRDQVVQDMTRAKMLEAIKASSKLGELLDAAEQGGWTDLLRDMSIDTLYQRYKTNLGRGKSKRINSDEKTGLKTQVIAYVKANPGSKNADIAKALKKPSRQVGIMLRELVGEGVLSKDGERALTSYSANA